MMASRGSCTAFDHIYVVEGAARPVVGQPCLCGKRRWGVEMAKKLSEERVEEKVEETDISLLLKELNARLRGLEEGQAATTELLTEMKETLDEVESKVDDAMAPFEDTDDPEL